MKCSVWLVPSAPHAPLLRTLLQQFCTAFGSPEFLPHLTVCTGLTRHVHERFRAVRAAELTSLPLGATFRELQFGEDYFHGSYLTLDDDSAMRDLQRRLASKLEGRAPEKYAPHVSLSYGVLNPSQRDEAQEHLRLPLEVSFSDLELWDTSGDVPAWHRLQT